jgi:hypothetical protein
MFPPLETACAKLAAKPPPAAAGARVQRRPKKFLDLLDREVLADLEVHLILDNYATHKTPTIKRWLLRHPRFVLHFRGHPSTTSTGKSPNAPLACTSVREFP